MMINIGDALPDIALYEYTDDGSHPEGPRVWRLPELVHKKKVVAVGVIGAFTPVCSQNHIPGYVDTYDQFRMAGIDEIWCISVNDPFVLWAWSDTMSCHGRVRMLSDGSAELVSRMNLTLDLTDRGMGVRSDRFVMVIDNGVVVDLLREDPGQYRTTDAETVLKRLSA